MNGLKTTAQFRKVVLQYPQGQAYIHGVTCVFTDALATFGGNTVTLFA